MKKIAVFSFLSVVLGFSLACSLFSAPVTGAPSVLEPPAGNVPTDAPSLPTEAPVVPTEPPAVPTEAPAELYFTEEFDGPLPNWSQEVVLNAKEGDVTQAQVEVKDGYLVFDLGKWLIAYMFYDGAEYDNVRIDVRADNRGTNVNNMLMICRASEEGHYLVNIANSGLFSMYAYDGAKGTYTRISNGGSTKIKPGKEINDYALVCNDRTLIVYINGTEARRYTDNDFVFRKGQVGVGVASEDKLPVKIELDWVKISEK